MSDPSIQRIFSAMWSAIYLYIFSCSLVLTTIDSGIRIGKTQEPTNLTPSYLAIESLVGQPHGLWCHQCPKGYSKLNKVTSEERFLSYITGCNGTKQHWNYFIEKTTISKLLALLITLKTVQNQQFVWKRKGPTLNEPSSTSVQSPSRPLSSPLTISADIAEDGDLFQMSVTLDGKLLSFNIFFNSASFHKNITNMAKLC